MEDQIQNPGTTPAAPTTDTTPASATPTPAPAASAQPAPAPADPAAPPAAPAAPVSEPKVLTIPTHAMKQIKTEERERGRSEALQALDAEAQSLGFANHAEMKAYAAQLRKNGQQAPQQAQQQPPAQEPAQPPAQARDNDPNADKVRKLEQERDKALEDKKRLNRIRAREEREKKELQRKLNEMEVSMELKLAAKDAGVVDVDYAVEVLKRAIKGMSEDDLKGFDESKFFREQLRQSHPHLYQVEQRPVTTGTPSTPTAKPAPAPGNAPQQGNREAVDARKLPPHEFQALLRKRGLADPATGGMMS